MGTANWVREGRADEDEARQTAVQRWRQGRSAGSMSTTVWKRNEEIDGSSLAGPRLRLMQSRLFMFNLPAINLGPRSGWPLRLQVSVAAILSTHINSGVWRTRTRPSRTNDFVSVKFHFSGVRRTFPSIPNEFLCVSQSVIETVCDLCLKKTPAKPRLWRAGTS